jgi:hypothetical protein
MKRAQVVKFAAGTMSLALVPALGAACGGDDSTSTTPAPTQAANTGATSAATTAATAAATAAKSTLLFIDLDTIRGSKNIPTADAPTQSCVQLSRFAKNEQIVFRARIYDTTGKAMDDTQLQEVRVTFKDGTTDVLKYGPHPKDPPNESFWTWGWVVPATYPVGTLEYTVTATSKDGAKGTFKQIGLAPCTITDTVRPVIVTQ